MKCGLVILNYNDYLQTENLLYVIRDYPEIDNIVIVDNDSSNDSYLRLKKHESSKISVIQSGRNGGYSFGNNVGARFLIENFHPDIIGIANPDTIFDSSLVRRIKEVFTENPDYAVLVGFQTNAAGEIASHPFWENFGTPGAICCSVLWDVFVKPFMSLTKRSSRYAAYVQSVLNSPKIPYEVWAVEGSLFFVRTEDFENAGMFDEKVFLYFEEDILAFKLHKLGRKIGVVNDISFIHQHVSADSDPIKQIDSGMRFIKRSERSLRYYFCNYVTDSKILHALFSCLLFLRRAKAEILCIPRKGVCHAKRFIKPRNI